MTDAVDLVHVLVAVALTYTLGFERDLRGSAAGDRVFALTGIGFIGAAVVSGRTWGECRYLIRSVWR